VSPDRALSVAVHEPGRPNSGIRRYGEVLAGGLRAHGGFDVGERHEGMGLRGRRGIGQALALARALRGHDAVVLPYTRYHVVAPTATRLAQILLVWPALRRRTVTVLHDAYAPGSPRHVEWWAVALVLALSGRVVIHSEHERDQIASVPLARRAEVVPHFIVERPQLDRAQARAQLGVAEDRTILGVVGWIQPRKNYELAIEALARLGPEVELWFVGGPGLGQEGYVESIERLARSLGVGERLLVTGALPEAEFERRLAALDVGLCPYRRISASGSLSTLLGAHRPVIASDVAFVRELASLGPDVVHTFDPPDAAVLAATVAAVLARPAAAPDAFDALLESRSVAATAARYAALLDAVSRRGTGSAATRAAPGRPRR
jgi:glycosyltransferase involved in cell wall biosynthesis